MKMYLPFGDWSNDGHGKWDKMLIAAPSMEYLLNAQKKIKDIYGEHFFNGMANQYEVPCFSKDVWQALKDSNYPIERMWETEDCNDWSDCNSIDEVLAEDECPSLSIDFIMDVFIWLLNWQGAEITCLDSKDDIPMICNWTCNGFETVGYGCFW